MLRSVNGMKKKVRSVVNAPHFLFLISTVLAKNINLIISSQVTASVNFNLFSKKIIAS